MAAAKTSIAAVKPPSPPYSPVEERPGARHKDCLAARNAVYAVHEVEQVGEPGQRHQPEQTARPDSVQPHVVQR